MIDNVSVIYFLICSFLQPCPSPGQITYYSQERINPICKRMLNKDCNILFRIKFLFNLTHDPFINLLSMKCQIR